jgi:ankyrin repeat protein/glyoxylase-like metal-dependent hydrolase (beta-lactamase superfamily II)
MKKIGRFFFVVGLLLLADGSVLRADGQAGDELPLHTQKFSDKVLLAWVGDYMQTIRVVALSTARGVVVIEANLSRSADVRIRQAIEKEFGRKDIKYLINTHSHHDHTLGNQVYADATIVGQRKMIEGMKAEQTGEGLARLVEMFKKDALDWGERQKKAKPDSGEFQFFREGVVLLKTTIAELQNGFIPTYPSVLFDNRLTLDMGDMTLELYAVGGTHTESDIMIFIPEEGLVAIGDMWPDQMLPYLNKKGPWDLGAILENWGKIVESGRQIKHVNFAHSDMKLSVEAFKEQYRYLKTLWDGLRELHVQGSILEDAKKKYVIERDFPYFKARRLAIRDLNIHDNNVEAIWAKLGGSAAKKAQEIFDAVKKDDVARVKQLLEKDASGISRKDASGNTPLHIAAARGSSPITELLISEGADIDATNTELNTPLHAAIQNGRDDISKLLIENGADLNKHNASGYTPLHSAALNNRRAVAEALISKGADIESQSQQQYTPLGLIARSTESFEVAELLVQKGANINARDAAGRTPLNNAVLYSSDRIIDLLLDHKAEIGLEPRFLRMMLYAAAQRGHLRSFQFIAEKGGEDLFKDDSENKILMRRAISGGSLEIAKMLQARNVPLDVSADIEGLTPLHDAAGNPRALAMIGFLIKNGADVRARTNDGRSAYNIAEAVGNKEAMSLILKHGGNPEPQKFPDLTGSYMGQTPPGHEPKSFAPGIVSPSHGTITVSPDGNEMYWADGTRIMGSWIQDRRWTKPAVVSFSGRGSLSFYDDVPFLTPDNRKLFFTSRRPLGSSNENKENIWYVERTPSGWSEPKLVSAEVNAMQLHWQVSVSRSGTLYFGGTAEDSYGLADIYCSRYVNGEYTKPSNLGPIINSDNGEMMPCIAPDESFLIFYRVVRQRPSLYISFKAKGGQWLPPKMIERVSARVGAVLSLDGKYLFFDNRWVSANIIEELRPKEKEG